MLTTLDIENKLKALKSFVKAKYFVSKMGYFGSFTQGTVTKASDVDISIELKKPLGWEYFDPHFYLESTYLTVLREIIQNNLPENKKQIERIMSLQNTSDL